MAGGSATEGAPGRVFRTTDGGRSWDDVSPPGTEGLLFRDVEARSAKQAVVLAIGVIATSRPIRLPSNTRRPAAALVPKRAFPFR